MGQSTSKIKEAQPSSQAQLPLEVCFEIIGQLDLKSIFALSQTCSAFRVFFKDKKNAAEVCSKMVLTRLASSQTLEVFKTAKIDQWLLPDLCLQPENNTDSNPILSSAIHQHLENHNSECLKNYRKILDINILATKAPYFLLLLDRQHSNIWVYGCQVRTVSKKSEQLSGTHEGGHPTREYESICKRWMRLERWFYSHVMQPVVPLMIGNRSRLPELVWFFGLPNEEIMKHAKEEDRFRKLAQENRAAKMKREKIELQRKMREREQSSL